MKKTLIISILSCILFPFSENSGNAQNTQNPAMSVNQEVHGLATVTFSTRLFKDRDDLTSVMVVIPSGSMVEIMDTAGSYIFVRYEGSEGYIQSRHASPVASPADITRETVNIEASQDVTEPQYSSATYDRSAYLTDKYGEETGKRIYDRKIWKGMTGEMIIDSWGNPSKISRVISGDNIREEWSYSNTWLFLSNDRLTEWGPSRD